MKAIVEYLLSRNTKYHPKYVELDENMPYDDVINFFIDKGYKTKECNNASDFFDPDIKEHILLILESPIGNSIRFILNLNVYKISFSYNQKYITNIFVIERKNGAHYNVPNSTHTVKNVIDEINEILTKA